MRRVSRSRPLRSVLALSLLLVACSPPPRLYSTDPVDRDGDPLDVSRVDLLLLENDTRRGVRDDETIRLEGTTFVIEGSPAADGSPQVETIPVSLVAALRSRGPDATDIWIDVHSPDDLTEFGNLPRIESVLLVGGRRVEVGSAGRIARWGPGRVTLRIGSEGSIDEDYEEILLDEIEQVVLHEPDFLGSTLRSPAFWIVTAATTALVIFVAGAENDDSLATR